MDRRGYGPRRGVVSRCGRCDCRRSQDGEAKKRGYPSGGRPCPRRSAHVKAILLRAQCTRRCCCTFLVSLALSLLSLFLWLRIRLMHHALSLHFSYHVLRGLFTDSVVSLSHWLLSLNSRADKLHSYSHLYLSLYSPSVLPVCPASPWFFFAFELPREPVAADRREMYLFSFLIPLTLALFSLSSSTSPALSL